MFFSESSCCDRVDSVVVAELVCCDVEETTGRGSLQSRLSILAVWGGGQKTDS